MKKHYLLILFGAIILAALFGYDSYKKTSTKNASREFNDKYSIAINSLYSNDSEKAVLHFEDILSSAPSAEMEASIKTFLAFAYSGKDLEKSISLLKNVAENTSYPDKNRAQAYVGMADIFMLGARTPGELTGYIFAGEPYETFPDTVSGGRSYAVGIRRLYERASDIYSLPVAEYRIAEWYSKQALAAKLYGVETISTPEILISKAKERLSKGDQALAEYEKDVENKLIIAISWNVKGIILGILSEVDNRNFNKADAEAAFKASLDFLNSGNDFGTYSNNIKLWVDFSYVSFLSRAYGKTRIDDIKKLTLEIADPQNRYLDEKNKLFYGLHRYLYYLGGRKTAINQERYDYENALMLAKLNPAFSSYLKALGWNI